ncbi:MAG: hypothetical protein DI598_18160 [Pseudopedobacter saltans]|uniref:Uncharacterized protein n=1 Tax=Pseudopedobacter saltans TaxID=151895 RepID=A0A2W5EEP7_9SPHI|nr:MAG: hypothetical protein DI598_18160 [Pseudopedobacter saltans]
MHNGFTKDRMYPSGYFLSPIELFDCYQANYLDKVWFNEWNKEFKIEDIKAVHIKVMVGNRVLGIIDDAKDFLHLNKFNQYLETFNKAFHTNYSDE